MKKVQVLQCAKMKRVSSAPTVQKSNVSQHMGRQMYEYASQGSTVNFVLARNRRKCLRKAHSLACGISVTENGFLTEDAPSV
jgi:hypothetical protein